MTFDLQFYALAIPAVLLTGISKGGLGGGLGGMAVPLMALAISPRLAASIMLPLLCLIDVVGIRAYWGKWDKPLLKIMVPSLLLGIGLGTLSFGLLSENTIRLVLGALSILFVFWKSLVQVVRRLRAPSLGPASEPTAKRPPTILGALMSALSGFASFVGHAGGPPVTMYLLSCQMTVVSFVATKNIFFTFANAVKVIPYLALGQFSSESLLASLTLVPLVPLGVYCGVWLQERIAPVWFFRLAQAGLLVTGGVLLYQGWPR